MSKKSSEANIRFGINDRIERARKIGRGIEEGANTVLTGAVFDSQNHPLVGAKVLLIQSGRVLSVRTGPKGVYKVRNVNPGLYRLVLSGIGYEGSNQMVDLKSGGTERRDFTLRKKNSPLIEKLIKNEMASRGEIRGSVHAPNLAPISNAVVELQALARPSFTARTLTDSRGEYVFKVFEGSYQVKAYLGVFQTEPQMVSVRAGVSARADFALKQKVISERGRGPSEIPLRSGQLKGCIIDSTTRKPVPGAIVSVQGQRSVRSDREGNYFVMKLAPGSYQVIVSSPGFQQQEKTVMIRADSSTAQDYLLRSEFRESSPNKPSSIIPRAQSRGIPIRNGQVRGQITNARSGRPIAGATVSISGGQSEASNQNGFYAITNLPPGTYRITIRKSGFSDSGGITTIRGGETVMENFRLNLRLDPLTPRGVLNPRLLKKR